MPRPPRTPPSFALGSALLAAGLVLLLITGIATMQLGGTFALRGQRITVPATVALELDPGEVILVMRELAGPHITANNPLEDPPQDLQITAADTDTGAPLATASSDRWMRMQFFGLERHRRALVQFTSPDHGRTTLTVAGSFGHPQVLYVGPGPAMFERLYARPLQIAAGVATLLTLGGIGLLIWRAVSLDPLDRPAID